MTTISKQEMFDRAWNGLKAQGWQGAIDQFGNCTYLDEDTGRRCAWGHVDPSGTACREAQGKGVVGLAIEGIGLAGSLFHMDYNEEYNLAMLLQRAHDIAAKDVRDRDEEPLGPDMEANMRYLALKYNLTIPGER